MKEQFVPMGQPIRVPKEISGVNDGIQVETVGIYQEASGEESQKVHCTLRASIESGVLSIAFGDTGKSNPRIHIRIDHLYQCINAAIAAHNAPMLELDEEETS